MFKNIARWIVITGTLALIAATALTALPATANPNTDVEIPTDLADQILAASVQIMILHPQDRMQFAPIEADIAADRKALARVRINAYDADLGLGTLIEANGATRVVTHNHWHALTPEARVRFLDAAGNLLVELDAAAFASLVLYQDPGTLVLDAPAELGQPNTAQIGDREAVAAQALVHLVRRMPEDDFRLEVLAVEVEQLDRVEGSPVFRLRTLDGQSIVRGDSGGGVWMDGELVGNNWMTRVNRTLGVESLSTFALVERPTAQSTAAQIPPAAFAQ